MKRRNEDLNGDLATALDIACCFSGSVEINYHGEVHDPEERDMMQKLNEIIRRVGYETQS